MLRAICGTQWFHKTVGSVSIRHSASCKHQSGTDEVIWRVYQRGERSEWFVLHPQSPDRGLLPSCPLSARNLQDEGTEASLPHLYALRGGWRSHRLQDARKTWLTAQRIKFVTLMDEQQSHIVLLQSIFQQSQGFFVIS